MISRSERRSRLLISARLHLTREYRRLLQGFRLLFALGLAAVLLTVAIGAGAQVFKPNDENVDRGPMLEEPGSEPSRQFVNLDIRVNAQGNLQRLVESNRLAGGIDDSVIRAIAAVQADNVRKGFERLKAKKPDAEIEISPMTAGVEIVRSSKPLSDAAPGLSGEVIVRNFLRANKSLYGLSDRQIDGLNFLGESVTPVSGLRMVRVEQILNGYPIFQSESRFLLDRDGRMFRSVGTLIPNPSAPASGLDGLTSPQEALRSAMASVDVDLDTKKMVLSVVDETSRKTEIRANDPNVKGPAHSRLVYFPVAPGVLVPAWSQTIFSTEADWYMVTDARDGTLLWRKNIRSHASTHDARFRVYVQADGITPADSPAPNSPSTALPGGGTQFAGIAPSIVSMHTAMDPVASPNGWIDDCPGGVCTAAQTQTLGNNTITCQDRVGGADNDICDTAASSVIDGNGRPTGNPDANSRNRDFLGTTPRDFQTNYLPPPQAGNPESGQTPTGNGNNGTLAVDQFRRAAITHLFYLTNWYHDRLFNLGFNEAAGNFQQLNFSGMGLGGDRVLGDSQDNLSTNNANFSTSQDGISGRMQMFRFIGPTIDRDGALDSEVVIHELTHGTSNRLIGNAAGLAWSPGVGLGEGWSDFYAMSLLNNTNADDPNLRYATGAYATYKFISGTFLDNYVYGIRRFPYSTDNSVNPMTWADVDEWTADYTGGIPICPRGIEANGAMEVHNSGEIWALSLWEMRARIIADPAGANGNVPTGNNTALRLVTDAMKMTPAQPSFIQARDALLDADCATNACANEESIWGAFADRGLGFKASAPIGRSFGYLSTHVGVTESFETPNLDINTVTVTDPLGVGNGSGFVDPDEPVRVFVNLRNGWRNAAKNIASASATLTSSTPGVSILFGNTTYGPIAAQGNSAPNVQFLIRAPAAAACGSRMNFTVTINSTLGPVARAFSIRLGNPTGTGAPVTYSRSALALSVPNSNPRGVTDSQTITDDFEIADLDFRVDSLLHTATGDVTVGLKGPTGYGTDLISAVGGGSDGGPGDNFINTTIDDSAGGDLLLATQASAPFTGSWRTMFNNASWGAFGFPVDPVGQLSRWNGTSTLGTWTVRISDQAQQTNANGTLDGWSLIVTPRAFTCTPFVPLAAGVSVSGRVIRANGTGIPRIAVTMTNSLGVTRTVLTNNFGHYRFDDVAPGQTYFMTALDKRYAFNAQAVTIGGDLTGVDFMAQ